MLPHDIINDRMRLQRQSKCLQKLIKIQIGSKETENIYSSLFSVGDTAKSALCYANL